MPRQAEPLQSTRLLHCVALALLLHLWLVLVVGTAPSGTAKPGDGVWGSLNVTLRGPRAEPGDAATALPVPPTPANAGPVGSGRQERFGGVVRPLSAPAETPKTPGAARLGAWSDTAVAEPRPAPVPVPAALRPLPQPETPSQREAAESVSAPTPAPTATTSVEATRVESRPPPRLLPLDAAPATALERLVRPVPPTLPTAPVTKLEPLPQRESVKAAPAPAAPAPTPTPTPAPPAPLLAAPMSLEAIEPRPALPSVLPPMLAPVLIAAPQPLVAKPVVVPAAARIAAPERLLPVADVEVKPQPQPNPVAELAAPAQPERLPTLAATPVSAATAATTPATAATAPITSSPAANPATTSAVTRAAASAPKPSGIDPGLLGLVPNAPSKPGAPDAGPRVGQDVATPPSASASAPRLNLQWLPPRGGELSSRGSRGVLQLLPVPPEHKSKLSQEMEKAGKADCRKAYGGIGLLAVLPLALDAARDKGCQW
jgi:hypothetical protein